MLRWGSGVLTGRVKRLVPPHCPTVCQVTRPSRYGMAE
jgi:hypothetical protein